MAIIAHLATLKTSVPFLHFFDGFRTSSEVQKIDAVEYDELAEPLMPWDKVKAFRNRALNPDHPHQAGTAQNPDIYFQNREGANKVLRSRARDYRRCDGEGFQARWTRIQTLPVRRSAPDADKVIMAMGSGVRYN